MSTHNICFYGRDDSNEHPQHMFYGEISKITPYHQIPFLSVPLIHVYCGAILETVESIV